MLIISGDAGLIVQGREALGQESETPLPDKTEYDLFHPTPTALLREMVTDRPDKTESPITLDAGHFQVEMDLVSYTRDHNTANGADIRTTSLAVSPINFKVGLANSMDFQLIVESWNWVETKDRVAGVETHHSGFGDVIPRVKYNFWGNDGGRTALGVMPFVKIPSNQNGLGNDAVEGGVIFPFAIELPLAFSLGTMWECDFNRNESNHNYHTEFISSVTLGHDLIGKLGGYVEFFSLVSAEADADWIGTIDVGLTYELRENLRLDGGVNIGVTRSADDLNPFIGLSFRF